MSPKRSIGAVRGRSQEDVKSMKNRVLEEARRQLDEIEGNLDDVEPEELSPETEAKHKPAAPKSKKGKQRKKRNHKIRINYFRALDNIISDSYEKQKAAYEVTRAVTQLFEARGQNVPFDEVRFERAAQNMSVCQMMREMSWLFGLSPAHTDRIVDHTIDKLFGNPAVSTPPSLGTNTPNPYRNNRKE